MELQEIRDEGDFTLYVLEHGYNFARCNHNEIGFYWLWKIGKAYISIKRTEGIGTYRTFSYTPTVDIEGTFSMVNGLWAFVPFTLRYHLRDHKGKEMYLAAQNKTSDPIWGKGRFVEFDGS